ncbi:MAG: methylmalonyl-CoA mutase family protein, partial [Pyrinomonadaceae bacterium]
GCWEYFETIDSMGGMVAAIENCFPQKEIQDSAYRYQRAVERKEKIIVGVNEFLTDEQSTLETLYIDSDVAERQKARLRNVRASRNRAAVQEALGSLRRAASSTDNLMPHFMRCAREYATLGEICDVLRSVFGIYVEPIF